MPINLRHISLIIGILTVILSFIFFGRKTGTYDIIIIVGLIISAISYLMILFKNEPVKNKIFWTLVLLIGIGLQWLSEPLLIRLSYYIFIKQNESKFSKINALLLSKKENVSWDQDSVFWKRNGIGVDEGVKIRNLLNDEDILLITKDSSGIYYNTFRMLDVSHGIFYYYSHNNNQSKKHITGNWYY